MKGLLKFLFCLVIMVAVLLVGVRIFDWVVFSDFYTNSVSLFKIPGVNEGYVPQGFDYDESEQTYLLTGYMSNGKASRVYVVNEAGASRYTELKDAKGGDYTGHTGGIAHFGDYIYITGTKGVDVFSYADVREDKISTTQLGTVLTYNDPAYCTVYNGYLFVGSFAGHDEIVSEHEKTTTPSGDVNRSIITVFRLDAEATFGVDPAPKAVITATDLVQGMCFMGEDRVALSTSWGLEKSNLFIYDMKLMPKEENFHFKGEFDGQAFSFPNIERYHLEKQQIIETIVAPPMAEEVLYMDGKIYVMNESASNKYIFGKFTSGFYAYAYIYRK